MSSPQKDHERQPAGSPESRSTNKSSDRHNKKKRKHHERFSPPAGVGATLSLLRQPDLPTFNLTTRTTSSVEPEPKDSPGDDWQTVENGRATKRAKKVPKAHSSNYPTITFSSDARIQSQVKLSDLQGLVLYLLADGPAPQWIAVKHRPQIRKVVTLMVPGLEQHMFEELKQSSDNAKVEEEDSTNGNLKAKRSSPDDYYPKKLDADRLPEEVKPFAEMFEHLWPMKTPGDERFGKMHSPMAAMLTAPVQKNAEEKDNNRKGAKPVREPSGWKNQRTRITEYISNPEELLENEYILHPAAYDDPVERAELLESRKVGKTTKEDGWVDTNVSNFEDGTVAESDFEEGSLTAGREVLAMDCEMCKTGEKEFSLTRISLVRWDGTVLLDELVKPEKPIIDYLTMYSGITEELLANVTTTLQDIQKTLVDLLHPRTILIGHSLNSDLQALKLTHPYIIDTSVLFPHPRGAPLKSSLKYLAQKYLNREIQKGHGSAGHNSIEDARTCLDLVKQKCEKGKSWGNSDAAGENLFRRIARSGVSYKSQGGTAVVAGQIGGKTSAAIDWGDPKKGAGAAATNVIGCHSDEEVVVGIKRAVLGDPDGKEVKGGGVDFVWGRLRELEALKGWWNNNKQVVVAVAPAEAEVSAATVADVSDVAPSTVSEISTSVISSAAQVDAAPAPATDPAVTITSPATTAATTAVSVTTSISAPSIPEAIRTLTSRLREIYDALPPCTAFIIYSGSGDPREMSRLQQMQQTFKREYRVKKWDELSVKWTDVEEQALKRAARDARDGIAFMTVK